MSRIIAAQEGRHITWLAIVRIATIAIVAVIIVLFAAGLVTGVGQLKEVCSGQNCHPEQLSAAEAALNDQLGFSLAFFAWFTTFTNGLFGAVFLVVAALIILKQSHDWMALFVALVLTLLGAGAQAVIPTIGPILLLIVSLAFFPLFALFPDGRFVPRWIRWPMLAWFVWADVALSNTGLPTRGINSGPPGAHTQFALLAGMLAQIYRYRNVATPVQRQQTKWVVFGFAGMVLGTGVIILAVTQLPVLNRPGPGQFLWARYVSAVVSLLPALCLPVSVGFSVLRYRLWDIDLIIRRTLVFGVLTALLGLLYFAVVTALQGFLTAVSGQDSPAVIVVSTLAIAAMFAPLRRRVQDFIDRRFFRRKYDPGIVLDHFANTVQHEVDLERVTAELARLVDNTLQPESISVWLK